MRSLPNVLANPAAVGRGARSGHAKRAHKPISEGRYLSAGAACVNNVGVFEDQAMKVLLVDDHVLFREGLKFLLRSLDAALEVMEAGNCAKALELAAAAGYDLVLLH